MGAPGLALNKEGEGPVSYAAAKLFGVLTSPGNDLLLLLLLGLALSRLGRARGWPVAARIGGGGVWLAALLLLAIAVLPLGAVLERRLETRFPAPALPDHLDGIIVLGGAADPLASAESGRPELTGAAERLTVLPDLARRYPDVPILFTGGSGRVFPPYLSEAPVARATLLSLGMDAGRVRYEDKSRTTWENALYTRDILHPAPGQVWLLVTSAAHMPRAVGTFRRVGFTVLAYPVDLRVPALLARGLDFDLTTGLDLLSQATHEYVGLVSYWLVGRSDALFPRPQAAPEPPSER